MGYYSVNLLDDGIAVELDGDRGAAARGLELAAGRWAGDDLGRRPDSRWDVVVPAATARIARGRALHEEDVLLLPAAGEGHVHLFVDEGAAGGGLGDLILTGQARAADAVERGLELRGHVLLGIDDEGFGGAALARDRVEAGLRAVGDVALTKHTDCERADARVAVQPSFGQRGDLGDGVRCALRGYAVGGEHGDHTVIFVRARPGAGLLDRAAQGGPSGRIAQGYL